MIAIMQFATATEGEMEPFPITILISLIVVSLFVFIGSYWFGKNRK